MRAHQIRNPVAREIVYADDDLPAAILQDGIAYGDMATLDACLE